MRAQHFLIEQIGLRRRSDRWIVHEAAEQDHLAKIRRRLRQRHRITRRVGPRGPQHARMPRMPDLMSQRDHVMHRAMEGHVNALLMHELRSGAKRARALPCPRLRFDPSLREHFTKVSAQFRIRRAERAIHRRAGFVPGELFFIRRGDLRCLEVKVVQRGCFLNLRRFADRAPWQLDVRVNGLQHRIERRTAHRAVKERRVEEVQPTATAIKTVPRACDAIQRRRERDRVLVPRLLPIAKRRLAQLAVRFGHQGASARHRHRFRVPVRELHGELHLASQRVVKPTPRVQAVHVQICRQRFHFGAHLPLPLGAHPRHRMLRVLQSGLREHFRKRLITQRRQRRLQRGLQLHRLRLQRRNPRLIRLHRLIVRIICRQAAEKGRQMPDPVAQRFQIPDHSHHRRRIAGQRRCPGLQSLHIPHQRRFEVLIVRLAKTREPGNERPAVRSGSESHACPLRKTSPPRQTFLPWASLIAFDLDAQAAGILPYLINSHEICSRLSPALSLVPRGESDHGGECEAGE